MNNKIKGVCTSVFPRHSNYAGYFSYQDLWDKYQEVLQMAIYYHGDCLPLEDIYEKEKSLERGITPTDDDY
jgi:hypothetical protein